MDWKTAKNYIIILLAIMNIILVISIIGHNNNASIDNPYFSKKSLENFEKLMQEKGIELLVELPREVHTVASLNVEYERFSQETYPELFDDFQGANAIQNSKMLELLLPADELFIQNTRYEMQTEGEQKIFAEDFLERYFADHKFHLKYTKDDRLVYNPLIDGILFEESFVEFSFIEGDVIIRAALLQPKEGSSNKKGTMTSMEAILNALPQLSQGDRIVGIDFIYYFDLEDGELYRVKDARAFPSWRIITERGEVIYILAFKN